MNNVHRYVVVVVVVIGGVAGVQIADPARTQSIDVDLQENPPQYTDDAIERLRHTDHRMRVYRNKSATDYRQPQPGDLWRIQQSDISDREINLTGYPNAENPYIVYENSDGVWVHWDDGSWRYRPWSRFTYHLSMVIEFVQTPSEADPSAEVTEVQNTEDMVVVRVNSSLVDPGFDGRTFITIDKATRSVTRIRENRTDPQNNETWIITYDRYDDVDVTRPPDAEYTLDVFIEDIKRGPIPFHWIL